MYGGAAIFKCGAPLTFLLFERFRYENAILNSSKIYCYTNIFIYFKQHKFDNAKLSRFVCEAVFFWSGFDRRMISDSVTVNITSFN